MKTHHQGKHHNKQKSLAASKVKDTSSSKIWDSVCHNTFNQKHQILEKGQALKLLRQKNKTYFYLEFYAQAKKLILFKSKIQMFLDIQE